MIGMIFFLLKRIISYQQTVDSIGAYEKKQKRYLISIPSSVLCVLWQQIIWKRFQYVNKTRNSFPP